MAVQFGAFSLDQSRRLVARDGAPLHLTPKAFDLLALLAVAAPRLVTKAELHERLWPGTFVSDAALTALIKELRRVLGDTDRAAPIIRTAHRVGYALCLDPVDHSQKPSTTWHWLVVNGRRVALRDGGNVVGRDPAAQVWLDAESVSRRHARIVISAESVVVEDLGSKNGTRVGEQPLTGQAALTDGDHLSFGTVTAVFRSSSAGMSTATAKEP